MTSTNPICKLCGHGASAHRLADPIECSRCPDRVCQDGPDGSAYRLTKSVGYYSETDPHSFQPLDGSADRG